MKTLEFKGNGVTSIEEVSIPEPKKNEVLIKVHTSLLCGSEKGNYYSKEPSGYNSGHEFAGTVIKTNNTEHLAEGDRVTVNVIQGCGECFFCMKGIPQFCKMITYYGGGHAEYATMPEACCIKLPDNISFEDGVLLGGDTMGVAFRVLSKMKVIPGTVVFVSGAGPIGLGVISLLKYFGFYVVVSEPGEYRRNFAKNIALADIVLNPLEQDVKTVLGEMTQNMGPEYIIECSGSGKAQQQALELVRCQGTVIFAGENHEQINICPSEHIIHKEINLTGAFYYTVSDFHELIALYNRGFRTEHLISHRIQSSEAPEGFIKFFAGETGKVAITW